MQIGLKKLRFHKTRLMSFACSATRARVQRTRSNWRATSLAIAIAAFVAVIVQPDNDAWAQQYTHTSDNFVVMAPDPAFARTVAMEAERFRKELAIAWLDSELPRWSEKCPIQVSIAPNAGGETSFAFMYNGAESGEPTGWDMKIFGSPERILDSVLPHEVTHTIFATHFRRPLPRWADEGACTTVEHVAEKQKNHSMLIQFLTSQPSRGIPFNRMFTMREYPRDILPLYAQGFSVAKFLIMEKGRRHFIDYVTEGMNLEDRMSPLRAWDAVTQKHYGYRDLSELQLRWESWVAAGSVEKAIPANKFQVARQDSQVPQANAVREPAARVASLSRPNFNAATATNPPPRDNLNQLNEGWYAKQMRVGRRYRPAAAATGLNEAEVESTNEAPIGARLESSSGGTVWR